MVITGRPWDNLTRPVGPGGGHVPASHAKEGEPVPGLLFDSDNPGVLLSPACQGCRIATYADLLTPSIVAAAGGRLIAIDRGHGDPLNRATIADIEPGLLSVAEGADKIHQWIAEKRPWPTAYHDRALSAEVSAALSGVPYSTWLATLDGTIDPPGFAATAVQFAGAAQVGFHADVSIVWNDAWNPIPAGLAASVVKAVKDRALNAELAMTSLAQAVSAL